MRSQNELSLKHQNELLVGVHESDRASPPHPRTNPSPVVLRLEKTPEPDTLSPRERAVASRGERPSTASVAPIPPLRDRHVG